MFITKYNKKIIIDDSLLLEDNIEKLILFLNITQQFNKKLIKKINNNQYLLSLSNNNEFPLVITFERKN